MKKQIFIMDCGPVVRRGELRICLHCGFKYTPGKELDSNEIQKHPWYYSVMETDNEQRRE